MGDQQSKNREGLPGENVIRLEHQTTQVYNRGTQIDLSLRNHHRHVFDSGGESDTQSSTSSSDTRRPVVGLSRKTSIPQIGARRPVSNRMRFQSSQMSKISLSVPDIARAGSPQEHFRRDGKAAHLPTRPQSTGYVGHHNIGYKNKNMSFSGYGYRTQKAFHDNHQDSAHFLSSQSIKSSYSPAGDSRHTGPVIMKQEMNPNKSRLQGSQSVLLSSGIHDYNIRWNRQDLHSAGSKRSMPSTSTSEEGSNLSEIDLREALIQFQQMQNALLKIQHNSSQILQEIDNEERENEEWMSVINKKAAGIESRMKKMEEKATEDHAALVHLADIIKTITSKFDDIQQMLTKQMDLQSLSLEANASSGETKSDLDMEMPKTVAENVKNQNELIVLQPCDDVDTSSQNDEFILDLSGLPNLKKDQKGYKDRKTDKKNDNRLQYLKAKRRKNKDTYNRTKTVSDQDSMNSMVKLSPQSLFVQDTQSPHKDAKPRQFDSDLRNTESFMDTRDDYRNLAVVATGERLIPSIQQEVILDTEHYWLRLVEREKESAMASTLPRGGNIETFMILDTSASMAGQPFDKMIRTAKVFIHMLCENSPPTYENLSIVEVGNSTRVLVHLTNDKDILLSALDDLQPGGVSPIMGALLVVKGLLTRTNTNIVVISDGKMTPMHIKAGQDLPDLEDIHLKLQISLMSNCLEEINCRVFFVPVGPFDSSFMDGLVKRTNGHEVPPEKIARIVNWNRNRAFVRKIMTEAYKERPGHTPDKDQFIKLTGEALPFKQLLPEEVCDMWDFTTKIKHEICTYTESDPNMLPLGTRVRRGPDWMFGNQDLEMAGTVVSHSKTGYIWVEWDYGDGNQYRYGLDGNYDVITTEDPRILLDGQTVEAGCTVRRGHGWKHGHTEDGGMAQTGSVVTVKDTDIVMVRWTNGNIGHYKFGEEVELCDPVQHRMHYEATAGAATGGPSHLYESMLASIPKIDDVDPMVAEMNRKNVQMSNSMPERKERRKGPSDSDKEENEVQPIRQLVSEKTGISVNTTENQTGLLRLRDGNHIDRQQQIEMEKDQTVELKLLQAEEDRKQTERWRIAQTDRNRTATNKEKQKLPQTDIDMKQSAKQRNRQTDNERLSSETSRGELKSKIDIGIPETTKTANIKDEPDPEEKEEAEQDDAVWQYLDIYRGWVSYSKDNIEKMEKAYRRVPRGSPLLHIGKSSFRILFSQLKQVNTKTKEMVDIRRHILASSNPE